MYSQTIENQKQPVQCVILAGGQATRLRPLTEKIPKALIEIQGKPFLDYQLRWLKADGITRVVMSIGYCGQLIRDYVEDGSKWGIQVTYVDEHDKLRGTGGALRLALEQGVLDEKFLVTYGDSFLPISYRSIFEQFISMKPEVLGLITVFRNNGNWDRSNVKWDGKHALLYDKENSDSLFEYIDYGLIVLSRDTVKSHIPASLNPVDLASLLHRLSCQNRLAAVEVKERFFEVGSLSGIQHFSDYLTRHAN